MPVLKSLSNGLEKLRNNPIITGLALFAAAISTIATFTDSASRLEELFVRPGPEAARAELSKLGIEFTAESLQGRAHAGDLPAVKTLIEAGMPVDAVGQERETDRPNFPALAEAVIRGDLTMTRFLLAHHADPSAGGGVALKAAARRDNPAITQLLLQQHPPEQAIREALNAAAWAMKLDAVRTLAAQLKDPKPALSQALWRTSGSNGWGPAEVVALDRALFELGADPNMAEEDGITPLMLASEGGFVEQVSALLEAGANVNAHCTCPNLSKGGWTALGLAANRPATDIGARLIAAGADVNARNDAGDTPLILATRVHELELVKALLRAGADVKARDRTGADARSIAAKGYIWPDGTVYFPELVKLLSPSIHAR